MTIERPMFPPRAEAVDSFPLQAAGGQPDSQTLTSDSPKPASGLSRRLLMGGLVALPAATVGIPAAASTDDADAELIALGREFEILVDSYYIAREPWARAMVQRNDELDKRFGESLYRDHRAPEVNAAAEEIDARVGLREASDRLSAVWEEMEPLANAINAAPVNSIEGLRAKALVAFWEVAPLGAGDAEFSFDDVYPFQQLFTAVAEVCGLKGKIAASGFELPDINIDEDCDDEAEDA
jgi:hypothetical protein